MVALIVLVVIGTTIWVGLDAYTSGRSRWEVTEWVFGCLLLWILCFPWYLVDRKRAAN